MIEKYYLHNIDQIHNVVLLCYCVELRLHLACTFHRSTTWTGQSRVHDAWGRLRGGDGEATGKCCFLCDGSGKLTLTLHGNVGTIGSNARGIVRG